MVLANTHRANQSVGDLGSNSSTVDHDTRITPLPHTQGQQPDGSKLAATRQPRPRKRRSRNGCFSCKKLKIKCDEATPSCEYCSHTGRICVYPPTSTSASSSSSSSNNNNNNNSNSDQYSDLQRSRSTSTVSSNATHQSSLNTNSGSFSSSTSTDIDKEQEYHSKKVIGGLILSKDVSNNYIKALNSMQNQMNVTRFEQKLLKFYLDFGGAFFTGNKNMETKRLFEVEVPKLWNRSPMIKSAMYAVASMYLWRFYQLNHISNVYLSGDQHLIVHSNNNPMERSLFEITDEYIQSTFVLLREGLFQVKFLTDVDEVGSVILTNVFLFTTISVHPVSSQLLTTMNGSSNYLADICQMSSGINSVANLRSDLIDGSVFESLLYREELRMKPPPTDPTMFPFIAHLRQYIDTHVDRFNNTLCFNAYHLAVDELDASCFRAVKFGYVLPILRSIMGLSSNLIFLELLRARDYVAMKIMYYFCAVVSICGIKMFGEASLWDSFVEEFKGWVDLTIGGFEEQFDQVIYNHVCDRVADAYKRRGKPFLNADQLMLIGSGKPLDSAITIFHRIS